MVFLFSASRACNGILGRRHLLIMQIGRLRRTPPHYWWALRSGLAGCCQTSDASPKSFFFQLFYPQMLKGKIESGSESPKSILWFHGFHQKVKMTVLFCGKYISPGHPCVFVSVNFSRIPPSCPAIYHRRKKLIAVAFDMIMTWYKCFVFLECIFSWFHAFCKTIWLYWL